MGKITKLNDIGIDKDTNPNWNEEDKMAEESIKKNPKLDLLRELSSWIINRGKSTINKTELFDWIDEQKRKIEKEMKDG